MVWFNSILRVYSGFEPLGRVDTDFFKSKVVTSYAGIVMCTLLPCPSSVAHIAVRFRCGASKTTIDLDACALCPVSRTSTGNVCTSRNALPHRIESK